MVRYNIIGTGFLDLAQSGMAFKQENQHFRFADISLGRSVEFSIPATDRNREMLGFGDDPSTYGDMLRVRHDCQCVYDGGTVMGTLAVTAYKGDAFSCVFYLDDAEWIRSLDQRKLSDCPEIWNKGVPWSTSVLPTNANEADPTQGEAVVLYDNGLVLQTSQWQLLPSINVATFLTDLFAAMGVPFSTDLDKAYWLVMASLNGGTAEAVTFAQTATAAASVTQSQQYFSVENITLEWAMANVFGAMVGGGSVASKGFKASRNLDVTFPATIADDVFLIEWHSSLRKCKTLGGGKSDPLAGKTVTIGSGTTFFFARKDVEYMPGDGYGWRDTYHPLSVTCNVARSEQMSIGEVWYLRNNMPDMTVFEFLRSVALATGRELTVTADGITLEAAQYGTNDDFVAIDKVVAVEEVSRKVEAWGDDTGKAVIDFDSEDYVGEGERMTIPYTIDNEHLEGEERHTVGFSEGAVGSNGILIRDVDVSSTPKLVAKRCTIAYADPNEIYLQRVPVPSPVGYDDIAQQSTCVRLRMLAGEAAFFAMKPSTTLLWQGMAYLWTDAQWSDDVLTLTLQKVSQYPTQSTQST